MGRSTKSSQFASVFGAQLWPSTIIYNPLIPFTFAWSFIVLTKLEPKPFILRIRSCQLGLVFLSSLFLSCASCHIAPILLLVYITYAYYLSLSFPHHDIVCSSIARTPVACQCSRSFPAHKVIPRELLGSPQVFLVACTLVDSIGTHALYEGFPQRGALLEGIPWMQPTKRSAWLCRQETHYRFRETH